MVKKFIQLLLIVGGLMTLNACSKSPEFVTWQEEVKLNDGRTIVITQKKRCVGGYTGENYASCLVRGVWLTINLPEFSAQPIIWTDGHDGLDPIVVNIDNGRLYFVGTPQTEKEFRLYGKPDPYYVGFVWENNQWKRIPFNEIPVAIYDTNMLIERIPPTGTTYLTLKKKESPELNGNPRYRTPQKRIDPTYKSPLGS